MIHGLRIRESNNKDHTPILTYTSHFVRTNVYLEEQRVKQPVILKIGWLAAGMPTFLARMAVLAINKMTCFVRDVGKITSGTANTALEFHEGRLMALNEGSLPFQIRVERNGGVNSVGYLDYGGILKHAMTAHPKVDSKTGEMRFFNYSLEPSSGVRVNYTVMKEGKIISTMQITKEDMPYPIMMHDFSITENYSILLDLPLVFDEERAKKLLNPVTFRKDLPSRLGVSTYI